MGNRGKNKHKIWQNAYKKEKVYDDINSKLVNLFRYVKYYYNELEKEFIDFHNLLAQYDKAGTLFYCDSPY